jgi:hypothetical protein
VDSRSNILGRMAFEDLSNPISFEDPDRILSEDSLYDNGVECATGVAQLQGRLQTAHGVDVADDFLEEFR